ncbi:uncharacterized protein LOC18438461 isoform X1 [Amborella trichopoda]|nr:uncharacterized protein LOC18438461 isoform X1 [Amborella trichopoda]|eukprot:XP_006848713.2 uncharacterized protein LOC18438461 isoform X1 [Amborella trichopoda]
MLSTCLSPPCVPILKPQRPQKVVTLGNGENRFSLMDLYIQKSGPFSAKERGATHRAPAFTAKSQVLQRALAMVASFSIILSSNPVHAGILSGFSGLESIPGPQLPQFDFLTRFNEENQKKYAEQDARFKSTTVLKELLERSKLNKQRNQQEIQDKYCIRGAEWGVGDCSTQGMTSEDRETFIATLKAKSTAK